MQFSRKGEKKTQESMRLLQNKQMEEKRGLYFNYIVGLYASNAWGYITYDKKREQY